MTQQLKPINAADLPEPGQEIDGAIFVTRFWRDGHLRTLELLSDEFEGIWGKYGQDVPGASSYSDGLVNTLAMAEAGSEVAKKALEMGAYIPAPLEGQLLMAAKADGLISLREDCWHHMSMQFSADYAYTMDFKGGWLNYDYKNVSRLFRPVRSRVIQ